MNPEDTSIHAPNMDWYENCPDNLDCMCLTDFPTIYNYEKTDMNYELVDEKSFIKQLLLLSMMS